MHLNRYLRILLIVIVGLSVSLGALSSATPARAQNLTVSIAPTSATAELNAAGGANFNIVVFNAGPGDVAGGTIQVQVSLPGTLTFVSLTGTNWGCNSITLTCIYSPTLTATSTTSTLVLSTTATATGSQSATVNLQSPTTGSSASAIDVHAPDLTVSSSVPGGYSVIVGASTSMNVNITNNDTVASTGSFPYTLTATIPAGLSFSAGFSDPGCGAPVGNTVTCTYSGPAIPAGGTQLKSIGVTGDTLGSYLVAVSVSGGNDPTASASVNIPVNVVAPDLSISGPASPLVLDAWVIGSPLQLTITNNSATPTGSTPYTVTVTFPAGLSFEPSTSSSGCPVAAQPSPVVCTFSTSVVQGSPVNVNIGLTGLTAGTHDVQVALSGGGDPNPPTPITVQVQVRAPDLSISKSATGSFVVGLTGQYNFTVTNNGNGATAATTTVTDTLPTGMYYSAADTTSGMLNGWTCSGSAPMTCTYTNPIAAGGSASFSIKAYIDPAYFNANPGITSVNNQASVSVPAESNTGNNTSNLLNTPLNPAPKPDMSVAMTCSPLSIAVTTNTTCSITLTNVGTVATSGAAGEVVLTITYPGASLTAGTSTGPASGWTSGTAANTVTWTSNAATVIAPSGTVNFSQVFAGSVVGGPYTVTAGVQMVPAGTDGTTGTKSATQNITVTAAPSPDLSIQILPASVSFVASTTGQYTVRVSNVSAVAVPGGTTVTVDSTFISPISATGGSGTGWTCTVSAPNIQCTRSDALAAGATYPDLFLNVAVAASPTGNSTQGVSLTVTPGTQDSNALNNNASQTTTVTSGPQPDLAITSESHVNPYTVGINGAFTITVENVGTGATTQAVTVTKTLPTGFTLVPGVSGGNFTCSGTNIATCTRSTAIPASSGPIVITLQVTPSTSGTFSNTPVTVSVTGPDTDSNSANNTFSDPTQVIVNGVPQLTVSKTEQPAGNFVVSNGTGTYRITVTNVGQAATSGTITVTDTLPGVMTFQSASPITGGLTINCSGSPVVTCTTSYSIPATGSMVFDLTVTLTGTGTVTNNVSVTGGGFSGSASGSDTTTVDAAPSPNLSINKTAPATMQVGTQSAFTLQVTNIGVAPTNGTTITIQDTLPAQMSFVATGSGGGGFTCSGAGTISCTGNPVIAIGGSVTITLNVLPNTPGSVTNTATASGGGQSGTTTSNTASVTINAGPPNLSISKTPSTAFTANQDGVYTITVQNAIAAGPTTGNIVVTDTLPTGMRFISGTGTGFICVGVVNTASPVTCTRTTPMGSGEIATISLTVNPDPLVFQSTTGTPFNVINQASVTTPGNVSGTPIAQAPHTVTPINPQAPASTFLYTLNPTTAPADNTTLVTLTITVTRMNGTPAAGDTTVSLSPAPMNGVTITPSTAQVTNGAGQAIFQIKSSVAGSVVVGVTAFNTFGSVTYTQNLPTILFTGSTTGTTSASTSTVVSDFSSIPADGTTKATVTVTVRDASNNPLTGKPVTLTFSPSATTIQVSPTGAVSTAADGTAKFTVSATAQQGPITFSASVTDGSVIFINQTVQITFTAPGTKAVAAKTGTPGPGTGTPSNILTVPTGPITGRVVAYRLRVRTGPGLDYPIIGLLQLGTDVSILARNQRGTWYLIQLQTGTAWVSAAWVRVRRTDFRALTITAAPGTAPIIPVPSPLIPQEGQGVGRVNTFLLRVRTGPGTIYPQIGVLSEGTQILLLGVSQGGQWYKFQTTTGEAWVSAFYVKVIKINGNRLPTVEAPPVP